MAAGSEYAWVLPYNRITTNREEAEQWRDNGMTGIQRIHVDHIVEAMGEGQMIIEQAEAVTFPDG